MKVAIRNVVLWAGIVLLSGCGKVNESTAQLSGETDRSCSSPTAAGIIGQIFGDGTEARARDENKTLQEAQRLDLAKVRALAGEIQYELNDVITTKNDPNSTKRFCEADLKIVIPDRTIQGANQARKTLDHASIQSIAEDANFAADLNKFVIKISYNVQPTDDGKKIYVRVENAQPVQLLVSEAVLWSVVGARQSEVKTSSVQQAMPKNERADTIQATSANAQPATVQASPPVDQALIDSSSQYMALEREINVVWNSLPKEIRDANLVAQREFNKEKEIVCMKEANAAVGNKFELTRNQCWSRFYLLRIPQLKNLI